MEIKLDKRQRQHETLKLWALPELSQSLLVRGIRPESIPEVENVLDGVNAILTPAQAVAQSFTVISSTGRFGIGRYGDGSFGVFYSAIELDTCIAEVKFHLERKNTAVYPRFYRVIRCDFSGTIADLRGQETHNPDLVSADDSGYPFCRRLAATATAQFIDAFHAPSARKEKGTCVPVFSQQSLDHPNFQGSVEFSQINGTVETKELS